ncbi:MAG TPA: biopolymer transporter ExbD [Bacteroidales bacterium]|nr:biopolymer transporter ExbD [Bacteroidales bacterium]HPS16972.1 biopolymer transporter ExbD [Bacteroidales bacterium]
MNLRKRKKIGAEVSTSAMNDIMFFLMLFFIIMSTILNPSVIKLTLPNSKSSQAMHKKEVALSITKDKRYYIGNTETTKDNLEVLLAEEIKGSSDAIVVLRVDNALSIQDLVDVLQIGNKLNVKMILATKTLNG